MYIRICVNSAGLRLERCVSKPQSYQLSAASVGGRWLAGIKTEKAETGATRGQLR